MTAETSIRPAVPGDIEHILSLAEAAGLAAGSELEELAGMLGVFFDGALGDGHQWLVDDDGSLCAAAYFAPEMMTQGTWNLYFIAVQPALQGQGRGGKLLSHVEHHLKDKGERILIIETSGLASFELTRAFYDKHGYDEEARIREFYAAGDDKVVFRKAL